jgi:hypothetical protein
MHLENAKTPMASLVSNRAERRRKFAVTQTLRILATPHSRAKRTSHARARYSLLATARLRSRR